MRDRITNGHIQHYVDLINNATKSPSVPWIRVDGRNQAQIGNYHISGAYGGVSLHRMCSNGGGITDVFSCGHIPKRDLYNRMRAFYEGLEA